jgi:dipeptidyl aminopeptidase/acylaminoacyl peptidase
MNHFTLEDALKLNSIHPFVPIDITSDGRWLAYTVYHHKRDEGGGTAKSVTMEDTYNATVWVTETPTGQHRNLTPDGGSSSAPRWAPDARRLAFFSDREGEHHLCVWNLKTDEMQAFTEATAGPFFEWDGPPKWTPNGRFVLFKALSKAQTSASDASVPNDSRASQEESFVEVWDSPKRRLQEQKRETTQETQSPEETALLQWNRDLMLADVETGDTIRLMQAYRVKTFDIAPNGAQVAVTVALGVETPGSQQQVFDLYVLPLPGELSEVNTGEIEPLVRRIRFENYAMTVSWSPDSRSIAYTTAGQLVASGDAFVVDVKTGAVRNLTEALDVDLGQEFRLPLWTEDGTALLCIAQDNVWRVRLEDEQIRNLTEGSGLSVRDIFYPCEGYTAWTVDDTLTMKANDVEQDRQGFYRLHLTDGTITPLHEDEHRTFRAYRFRMDVAEETGQFVYSAENYQEPEDLWISDAAFESPRRVTNVNPHFEGIDFGESQFIEWSTDDGKPVKGILVLPREASKANPVPMIVSVYPGAEPSHGINSFGLGEEILDHPAFFVSRGIAVFYPAIPVEGVEPYKQIAKSVLPGLDAAIATGKVDAQRMGVIGQSFGGYAVNVLITETTRFKAAVAGASLSDLISSFLSDSETGWHETGQAQMGGTLWEFPQRYIDGSPVFHLDRVETPLLLVGGDQDGSFEQGKEMFNGLARLGKKAVLAKYKEADHWHGNWSKEKLADYWERVLNWFDEYLK